MSDRTPPGIPDRAGGSGNRWVLGCAGIVLGIGVLIAGCTAIVVATNGVDDYDGDNQYEAIAQCEAAVEERLKAPSTAEFNSTATGGGTWVVTGTVDAENSFGAMVRNSFECSVIIEGDSARVRINYLE